MPDDSAVLVDADVRIETLDDSNGVLSEQTHRPTDPPEWVKPVKSQLIAMFNLTDNWDGEGGEAPAVDVIRSAIGFVEFVSRNVAVERPHVSPTRCGDVLLEWESGPHQLEVEVEALAPSAASYVYLNTETDEEWSGALFRNDADDGRFLKTLRELFSH